MTTLPQNAYLHGLRLIPEVTENTLETILAHFEHDFEKAYYATISELLECGLNQHTAEIIANKKSQLDLEFELMKLSSAGISIISYVDALYPELLHQISHKPALLYYRGSKLVKDELALAIVGTRKMSAYGKLVTETLTTPLTQSGLTIISGLAFGIDAVAHYSALSAGGRTIAVVGSGLLDSDIYPKTHLNLAHQIINTGGLLLSEYPPGTPALKQHFIARNRIIAGLSVGTLVVECPLRSGALITAKYALEQNRNVYTIPHHLFTENSAGPHMLLKKGAQLVTEAEDILIDLNIPLKNQNPNFENLNDTEKTIVKIITAESHTINQLVSRTNLDIQTITAGLITLEMKGLVKKLDNQIYTIIRSK